MIFIYKDKKYYGAEAVEIVRALERDSAGYANPNGTIQDFLNWSLALMADRIPRRDLDVSPHLSDETLAYDFLCLLDNYEIGKLYDSASESPSRANSS